MRILVVEDEPKMGDYLRKGLTESGYVVDLARTGREGLFLASEEAYDLIVLDVMLPGMDGWQVIQELRKTRETPVLFLTARDDIEDRVRLGTGRRRLSGQALRFRRTAGASANPVAAWPDS